MKVILSFWNREWQKVTYNTVSGKASLIWFAKKDGRGQGWAYRCFFKPLAAIN